LNSFKDAIQLKVTEQEVKSVMQKALAHFTIAHRNNLRQRHINIQFDCILRGYIGEYAMAKWLDANDIFITQQNFKNDADAIDIDFLYKNYNIELKTSLVPDADVAVENVIARRDIKLIKRKPTIAELAGDIHLQIVFNQRRKAKDTWLANQQINFDDIDLDTLYHSLLARCYTNSIYFVGFIDKPTLTTHLQLLEPNAQTWTFPNSQRTFWHCPIKKCRKPNTLPAFLKELP
jgi:hypothetical protein